MAEPGFLLLCWVVLVIAANVGGRDGIAVVPERHRRGRCNATEDPWIESGFRPNGRRDERGAEEVSNALRKVNRTCVTAMTSRAFLLWTALCGPASLGVETSTAAGVAGQRVFVTAHSFHIFVADRLLLLAKAAGITGHELVGKQMIGGSRVRQHWDLPDGQNPAKQALLSGDVDVLTMSHNWAVPDDGIELFTDLGLEHNPRLWVLVQISWPAFDHWEAIGNPAIWDPAKKISHNEERDARSLEGPRAANAGVKSVIEKQVGSLNASYGRDVIRVVPVGDAVLRLRERVAAGTIPGIKRQSELFTDPIGHGRAPVMALATYCNFACIYGRSPVGLDDGDRDLDRLDPKLRSVLQEIAWDTVTSCPMSGVAPDGVARDNESKRPAPATGDGRLRAPVTEAAPVGR